MSDKKLFLGLGVLLLILGGAYALSLGPVETPEVDEDAVAEIEQAYDETAEAVGDVVDVDGEASSDTAFDLNAAKRERILGDTSAPIKITEHSSFTCGHCGSFHKGTFDQLKANYIDTGKAYLVFSDFPLNAPALHASMAARCISEDRYFDFVEELFKNQEDWAYESNYLTLLQERAAKYGLDEDSFDACIQNEDLQEALTNRIRAVQQQWEVRSTPSFVINNQAVIAGALPYEQFEKALQDALAEINASSEPAASEESVPEESSEGE